MEWDNIGKKSIFSILAALILLLILTLSVDAQSPPAGYYGDLRIDGTPAPPDITIIAEIGGEERGRITTSIAGEYGSLHYPLWVIGSGEENNTAIVTFYADGQKCLPTVIWVSGNIKRVDLTFAVPTPTPTPTPTPLNGEDAGGDNGGGGAFLPTPSPTLTPTATPSPTETPALAPTFTPSASATPTQTPSSTIPPPTTIEQKRILILVIGLMAGSIMGIIIYVALKLRKK